MVKVSVVLPVYNVEPYLRDCMDSIVNQTLDDIEIICINDGSTDKSLDILNSYASKDDRFKVFSQENQGHAVATNRGIEMACGEYLYLMDSDDILKLTALEETYNYAEEKSADFVLFQSCNYVNDEDRYYKSKIYSMDGVADFIGDKVVTADDLGDLIFAIPVTPWSKLYNNDFIKRINVKFPEGLVFDDNVFFWDLLFYAKRIAFLRKYFFTRRWYSTSSTTAGDRRFIDSITIHNLMIETFKKHNKLVQYEEKLYNRKVEGGYLRYNGIKDEFKEEYFNALREDFKGYNNIDFIDLLSKRSRVIFKSCLNAANHQEFGLTVQKYDLEVKNSKLTKQNKKLTKENKKLTKENKKLNKKYKQIITSNSWKLTKPLRAVRNYRK